jgi:hypothetical protein
LRLIIFLCDFIKIKIKLIIKIKVNNKLSQNYCFYLLIIKYSFLQLNKTKIDKLKLLKKSYLKEKNNFKFKKVFKKYIKP